MTLERSLFPSLTTWVALMGIIWDFSPRPLVEGSLLYQRRTDKERPCTGNLSGSSSFVAQH